MSFVYLDYHLNINYYQIIIQIYELHPNLRMIYRFLIQI